MRLVALSLDVKVSLRYVSESFCLAPFMSKFIASPKKL